MAIYVGELGVTYSLVSGAFLGSDTVIGKIRSYYNQGRILIGYHKSFTDV
jgi:hypothetical protein